MLRPGLIFVASALLLFWRSASLSSCPTFLLLKKKRALEKLRQEETKLSQGFDVVVVQSGYRIGANGERDIYIPSLLVRATNISDLTSNVAYLTVEFLKKQTTFCMARAAVPSLKPGGYSELWLKCIDLVGFGSVAWGLSLAETTEGLDYVMSLSSGRASIIVAADKLRTIFF